MNLFKAIALWAVWSLLATVASAQDARCLPAGVGDKALKCTDGRGHYWYADINGVPSGTQQRQPIVYASPFRAAMEGRRAAIADAQALQELQRQQKDNVSPEQRKAQERLEAELQQAKAELKAAQEAQQNELMQGRQALMLPPNMKDKLAVIQTDAEKGEIEAQALLGAFYWYGANVPRNAEMAVKWFMKAAARGYSESQDSLALAYGLGEGVTQDQVLAYVWWNLAAAQGNENAARNLQYAGSILTPEQIAEAQHLSLSWKPGALVERDARARK